MDITDNTTQHRFEATVGDHTASAWYRVNGDVITFTHTEVPDTLRGQGIGEALARGALDMTRRNNRKVIALCPFIAAFIRRHSEYQDLLAK